MANYFTGAALTALIAAAPLAAHAADDVTTVDELVISVGARDPGGITSNRLGASVNIIDAETVEDRQARLVSDLLRDIPGIAVGRNGAIGGFTQVRVRGAEANHVLTLIDGIEATDPFLGEFDYTTLLADDIARIEVLRGPQSALYGSDAIGGVISYVTPSGRARPGTQIRGEYGEMNTWGLAARAAGVRGDLDYVLTGAFQGTDGYPTQTDGLGTRDIGSGLTSIGAKASYRVGDALKLRGVVRFAGMEADLNNSDFLRGSLIYDSPGTSIEAQTLMGLIAADYEAMDGRWTHSFSLQGADSWREGVNSGGFTPGVRDSRSEGSRYKASYVTTLRIETGYGEHSLTGAADLERESFQNVLSPFGADTTRRSIENTGLVADYRLILNGGRVGFGAAARHDNNDVFDDATTWRADIFWEANELVRLRAAAGTGIKNPLQTELFGYNAGIFAFTGNPNLTPEESKGWEVGADFSLAGGQFTGGITWFESELENEIYSVFAGAPLPAGCPDPGVGFDTTCNRATVSTQDGLEVWASAELAPGWNLSGAWTFLDAIEDGFEEIRRPPTSGSVNLNWQSAGGRFAANLGARYNGEMQDSNFTSLTPASFPNDPDFTPLPAPFGRVELPSFTLVTLAGEMNLDNGVQIFGRVENLFDEDYYEVLTFRTQPRLAVIGARKRF